MKRTSREKSKPAPPARRRMREARCIHCGCTDSQACAGGCSWVWVNRHTGKGVCSSCEGHAA